ncbi:SDR family NAD(P)-dependent oxidoreductase [Agilicoccus flavus]|uniref:SDR family NAD(P)-dependent oxidoreductase n=1 Tax=Agilicoccus flavus TaxID=2775968 RepID=UPI001CF622DE|nr:SDR family NAD(P)-dependent oxidoreductase [Agilicoccus flavus]
MKLTATDVALVTGGGSGLGAATARRLHEGGASVVLVDLESSNGAALAAELGERARFVAADVRDEDRLGAAVTAATELGTLRVAVACAGIAPGARILGRKGLHPLQLFKDVVDINLVGTFNTLRLAAQAMAENEPVDGDRGVVVMTASVAAFEGQLGQSAYSASKGGVAALTIQAARDLADKAIRVDTIAPGTMETPMMAGMSDAVKDSLAAGVPHPSRLGKPEEYASLVAHIVDNPMLNGEVIRLDGALRMPPR